jgi:hypothetical protein
MLIFTKVITQLFCPNSVSHCYKIAGLRDEWRVQYFETEANRDTRSILKWLHSLAGLVAPVDPSHTTAREAY